MPSAKVKLVVVDACDVLQVLPPSVLYSHVAPASMPLTVKLVSLVMLSLLLLPVSDVKATVGADGGVLSIVTVKLTAGELELPAVSVNFPLATLTTALPQNTLLLTVKVAV